jgi:hypothetical protein
VPLSLSSIFGQIVEFYILAGAATFLIFCSNSDVVGASWFKKELILVAAHVDFGPVSQAV